MADALLVVSQRFLFQTIHDVALMLDRERVGRDASPTGGVIDSQSVKAPEAKTRGCKRSSDASDISPSTPTVVC